MAAAFFINNGYEEKQNKNNRKYGYKLTEI